MFPIYTEFLFDSCQNLRLRFTVLNYLNAINTLLSISHGSALCDLKIIRGTIPVNQACVTVVN